MQKIKFKIRTISKVTISPRNFEALYAGIDYSNSEGKYSIIYPFYSYSNRYNKNEEYYVLKENIDYYIPASSFKGALLRGVLKSKGASNIRKNIYCNDIKVKSENISLEDIYKFQYIKEENKDIMYERFFNNIKIEMIDRNKEFKGSIFVKNNTKEEDNICEEKFKKEVLNKVHDITVRKLKDYKEELENILEKESNRDKKGKLLVARKYVAREIFTNEECTNKYLMFLGGFKGRIASVENYSSLKERDKGLYFDTLDNINPYLPYGLVELELL